MSSIILLKCPVIEISSRLASYDIDSLPDSKLVGTAFGSNIVYDASNRLKSLSQSLSSYPCKRIWANLKVNSI